MEHQEELEEEPEGPSERMETAEERREHLHLGSDHERVVWPSGMPPPYSARLTSAGRGNPTRHQEQTNQPTKFSLLSLQALSFSAVEFLSGSFVDNFSFI